MTRIDDTARALDTIGLAAWFGGSLMGVVAVAATSDANDDLETEDELWRRWSPVQNAAIAAHLLGAAKLATTNKGRLATQRGVGAAATVKGVLTLGALGATLYASRLGRELQASDGPDGGSSGRDHDGDDATNAKLRRLRKVQLAVPVLTGAMLIASSRLGEQQRPVEVLKGVAGRLLPDALPSVPEVLHAVPEVLQSVPVGDTARELMSKASEPVRHALHH